MHAYTATEKQNGWTCQYHEEISEKEETEALLHPCIVTLLIIVKTESVLYVLLFYKQSPIGDVMSDVMKYFQIIVISETCRQLGS